MLDLCWAPRLSAHLPSRTGAVTDPVPGEAQGGEALPAQSPPQQISTEDVLPDTDCGPGATAKGSHGATGLQTRKPL